MPPLYRWTVELPPGFQEVRWQSKALHKGMAFLLYLPPSYTEKPERHYPVLYLLHGSGHDPYCVLREVHPQDCLSMLGEALLVIPAGDQGWWLDSPLLPRSQYSQCLLELMAFMDRHYRTVASRAGRGLCGFSMGGYGAMLLASQHPELFGAASSLLGTLDIVQLFPDYHRLRLLLGGQQAIWQHYNPTDLAANLKHTSLQFCTAAESFDRPQNEAFAAALRAQHIPFSYSVYPGGHNTAFVREHIGASFAFHRSAFDQDA